MATESIGKVVKLNDDMVDVVIKAAKKPYRKVEVDDCFRDIKADSELIAKLKKL